MLFDVQPGDTIRMRKPHPCGSTDWLVTRIGADLGLRCKGCRRHLLLPRRDVARRMKVHLPAQSDCPSEDS